MVRAEEIENTRVPDAFTPVVGFRRFGIPWPPTCKHNDYLIQRGHRWTAAGPTVAECKAPGPSPHCSRSTPSQECACGLYAWMSLEEALGYHEITTLMGWVLASVVGWGRVFFDEDFWRAERAQLVAFADPEHTHADKPKIVRERSGRWLGRVATNYGVPILPLHGLRDYTLMYGEEYVPNG